jgi:hypothetical protein
MSFLGRLRSRLSPVLQSDRAFIETAYERILGRPVDPAGLNHYLAAFGSGMSRTDLLLHLVQSEELTSQLAKTARAKVGPRGLRPDRYRELVDRTNGFVIPVFEAESAADFDWLETRILEDRYYEKPGVWNLDVDLDKLVIAEIVAAFSPRRALELGCAAGAVIDALVEYGIEAEGVDISLMALNRASTRVRKRLHHGDLLSLDFPEPYDLLFGLDIFEHLNPNRLDAYITRMARIATPDARVFCNIPAFGKDQVFGTVFPYYIDGWEAEAAADRPFTRLHVDKLGYPLHGHLTWADARWWVRRFENAGFVREPDLEHALHAKYDWYMGRMTPARLAYFVFTKRPSAEARAAIIDRIAGGPSQALAAVRKQYDEGGGWELNVGH